jgi:quercetin dioxygenase-like cupin family protein
MEEDNTLIKNYFNLPEEFNFNFIGEILEKTNCNSNISSNFIHERVFDSVFQIRKVEEFYLFKDIFHILQNKFNPNNKESNIDIFFSFVSGGRSIAHADIEDVCIFGLLGKTVYLINNKEYTVDVGDLLRIPKGTIHKAIGLSPRIIGSYGTYG